VQIVSHLTSLYFFFVLPPYQKKILLCLSCLSATVLGSRYMDSW
jgi:hypothetical protein